MSDKAASLIVVGIVAMPWAIVALVALARGYNIKLWRGKDSDDG